MNTSLKLLCFIVFIACIQSSQIFMATNGNDSTGNGSVNKPYKTLIKCQEKANSDDIVSIRRRIYKGFSIADSDATYNYIYKFQKVVLHTKLIIKKKLYLILNLMIAIKKAMEKQQKELLNFSLEKYSRHCI